MPKYEGLYTGHGVRGRPFSRSQFNKSHVKKNTGASYSQYLSDYAKFVDKKPRKKRMMKPRMVRRNFNLGDLGFQV